MNNLEQELKKALKYIDANWKMQNNSNDYRSNFIYEVTTVEDVINESEKNNIDYKYALHRWYNFHTSTQCENIFVEYGARKERNYKHKKIDIYINGVSFDIKLTVYPNGLPDHPYNLKTRDGKNEMIKWLYKHQSQEQRKHLENRLFIVCDAKNQYESLCLKCNFDQIRKKIKLYLQDVQKKGFNKITIEDNNRKYIVNSDIIYICENMI